MHALFSRSVRCRAKQTAARCRAESTAVDLYFVSGAAALKTTPWVDISFKRCRARLTPDRWEI
jgi:hypothetical protein